MIPPKANAAFVAAMEDVLEVYTRPYDPARPLVCLDETAQLIKETRIPIASGGIIPIMGVVFVARFGLASFGKVMGLVMLVMVAGSLGPVFAAWIYDLFGSYHYAFMAFIAMTVPTIIMLKWLPPPLAPAK